MKGDHSRPQSELVGAPWAGPGAAAALQRPHPSPGPHSDALGDPRPWGVARRSRGAGPRSANPLPMETSMLPPLPALVPADTPAQNPSPAGHPWGVSPARDSEAGRGSPSRRAPPPGPRSGLPPGSRSLFRFAQRSPSPPESSQRRCAAGTKPPALGPRDQARHAGHLGTRHVAVLCET